jgi:hypothetical protein
MSLRKEWLLAFLYFVIIAFSLAACAREKVEIKNVVSAYNKMLPEALARPDARVMEYFTSPYELKRIQAYITYLRKDGRLLVSELKKIDFTDATFLKGGMDAAVKTREIWIYYYIDEKTRKRITEDETLGYENTYKLRKEDKRWVVNKVEIKEIDAPAWAE